MRVVLFALAMLGASALAILLVAIDVLGQPKSMRLQSTPPDRYGVVCYYVRFEPTTLSCVKVAP